MLKLSISTLAALFCFSALASETKVSGDVTFDAIGRPSMLKIHGQGKQVQGSVKQDGKNLSGEFVAKLDDLDTGMKLRNEHMKTKYLEIAKFPESKFRLDSFVLPSGEGDFKGIPFKGKLTIHGVEKSISGTADVNVAKTVQSISAAFVAKISDFGMQIPSFAGVTVAEDVQVKVVMKP